MNKLEKMKELLVIIRGLGEKTLTKHGLNVIIESAPIIMIRKRSDTFAFIMMPKDQIIYKSQSVFNSIIDLCSPDAENQINELIEQSYKFYVEEEKRKIKRLSKY